MKLHFGAGAIIDDGSGSGSDNLVNMNALANETSSFLLGNGNNYSKPGGDDGDILGDIFCAGLESQTNAETSFMICGCLTLVINTLGVLGNCMSLCILSTSFAKVSIMLYLIGLSVCDTVMLLVDIFCFVLPVIFRYYQSFNYYTNVIIPSIAPYAYPFADFGLTGSAYFTVAITIDRYIIVCWPLEAKSSCTMKRARYSSLFIIALSFVYNLPRFFEYTTIANMGTHSTRMDYQNWNESRPLSVFQDDEAGVGPMSYQVKITEFGGSLMYKQWYLLFCWFVFIFIIPFVILFVLNYLICRKVRESNKIRRCMSVRYADNSSTKQSLSITYMSVCLVVVFLACNIPFFINRIVQEFLTLTPIPVFVYTSNILISINSSVNWIIYCLFGKKFRVQFFRLLSCTICCLPKDEPWQSHSQSQSLQKRYHRHRENGRRRQSSSSHTGSGDKRPSFSLNSFSTTPAC